MKELVIDRSKWLRGETYNKSRLLRPADGKMCCLGFYSLACGLSKDDIWDRATPCELKRIPVEMNWLSDPRWGYLHSKDAGNLMNANDREGVSEAEREEQVTKIFAAHGIAVRFIDGPEPTP